MSRKAWLLIQETNGEIKTVDVISARKKIGLVEAYLCDLYNQMFGDGTDIKDKAVRVSGQEIIIDNSPNIMRAQLTMVDDETL